MLIYLKSVLMLVISASFTAIFNIVPFFFPFLSPRKISITNFANFFWQISFFHLNTNNYLEGLT